MRAEILSVGTELLLGQIVDTNASHIATELSTLGVGHYHRQTVGDNRARIVEALRLALSRADVVVTTGGLGPTVDDLTMACIAEATGRPLQTDPEVRADILAFFERIGRAMSDNNLKQALVPKGARVIRNGAGTAPGVICPETGGPGVVIAMPGVPSEMRWMMRHSVMPYLRERLEAEGGAALVSRTVRVAGIGESLVEDLVRDIIDAQTDATIAPYCSPLDVMLRVTASAHTPGEATALVEPTVRALVGRLGASVFGYDDDTMESVLGGLLLRAGWCISTAESCTGGLVAKRITDVPGSSAYFAEGYVTYSNAAKTRLLGVPTSVLDECGAVSPEVARAMANGCRAVSASDLALGITGIAGPDGGSAEKPVGLVYVGLASATGCWVKRCLFHGSREQIRARASQTALDMARRLLEQTLEPDGDLSFA